MECKYRSGARIKTKASASEAYAELEKVRKQNPDGVLVPQEVVQHAKRKTCKIHDAFEWDDAIAAQEHRKEEARYLARSIVIIQDERPDKPVQAYENVRVEVHTGSSAEHNARGYMPIDIVMEEEQLRRQAIGRALGDLNRCKQRYAELKEFESVWKALEEVEEQVLETA